MTPEEEQQLRRLQDAVTTYETFFQHCESVLLTEEEADKPSPQPEGITIDGNTAKLTPRALKAWQQVCEQIDARRKSQKDANDRRP
jgi:hypothetical protein